MKSSKAGKRGSGQAAPPIIWPAGTAALLSVCARSPGATAGDDNSNNIGGGLLGGAEGDTNSNNIGGGLFGQSEGDSNGNNTGGPLMGRRVPADRNGVGSMAQAVADLRRDVHARSHLGQEGFLPFRGIGYLPDAPDGRDHTATHLLSYLGDPSRARLATYLRTGQRASGLGRPVDLSKGGAFGPVDHQGPVQSCTSHAVTSMAEYQMGARGGGFPQLSRLFVYKVARTLLGLHGDTGATLRESLKALGRYGSLTEEEWPYTLEYLEAEPMVADLEAARRFRALRYCRLDGYNQDGTATCEHVLHALADGFPVAFGFMLYHSSEAGVGKKGIIPAPEKGERSIGGHAVLAVGYDLEMPCPDRTRGALKIRNSWGADWGQQGYGWLPLSYLTEQLACDFWVLCRESGTDSRAAGAAA